MPMICANPQCPDVIATGSPGEYVDGVTVCPVCGEPLITADQWQFEGAARARDRDSHDRPVASADELEPVIETDDPTEVQIIRSILDGAGIPCVTAVGDPGDRLGLFRAESQFVPGVRPVRFFVPRHQAEEARALLTEVEPTDPEDRSS